MLALSTEFNAIGHMHLGKIEDLLLGDSITIVSTVMLMLPNLVLACTFPWRQTAFQYFCELNTFTPIWPEPRHWQQIRSEMMPLPSPSQDPAFFLSLANRIEVGQLLA